MKMVLSQRQRDELYVKRFSLVNQLIKFFCDLF